MDARQTVSDGLRIFASWCCTPIGGILLLLLIGCGVLSVVKRGARWVTWLVSIVSIMFMVWIIGGILEAYGIPVRETIRQFGAWLPSIIGGVGRFLNSILMSI